MAICIYTAVTSTISTNRRFLYPPGYRRRLKSTDQLNTTVYILIYNLNRINGHLYIHRHNFNYINESPFSRYPGVQGATPHLI
jgi:hypothetical protein